MAAFDRDTSILLLIDYQDKMIAGIKEAPTDSKLKYTEAVVRAAAIVGIPVVLTTIDEQINGPFSKDLLQHLPNVPVIQRAVPGFNALDDPTVYAALKEHVSLGRTNIIVSGLWSSMCFSFTALALKEKGLGVYGLMDCCGDGSLIAHKFGIKRMIQAGVEPVTWMPVVSAWMNNWADPSAKRISSEVFGWIASLGL
jgi:nicotinamidase-related amidase